MTIELLTKFFMWCTIINSALMALWTVMLLLCPNLIYRMQSKFFCGSQELFKLFFYGFLGFFKMMVIVFCFVPWMALLIIGK